MATKSIQKFVTIFDDTYNQRHCLSYYQMLKGLGYRNHFHAVPVFNSVLEQIAYQRGLKAPHIFDFASSYGIVTALMKYDITGTEFLDHYQTEELGGLEFDAFLASDKNWYSGKAIRNADARFSGLDIAENAVSYGNLVGLFQQSFSEDIQLNAPSPKLQECLADVDLIVECGSVANLMPDALNNLLIASKAKSPWVVFSPVRGNEREAAFDVLRDHGLVIDTLGLPAFPHRKFSNLDEQTRAIDIARNRGHVVEGLEDTGAFFAQIYLARPPSEIVPVSEWNSKPAVNV